MSQDRPNPPAGTNPKDSSTGAHRNDMYGDISSRSEQDTGVQAAIPAATVVLLRDGAQGIEILMLKKNSKITFGGMWVFPGGKIDAGDYPSDQPHADDLPAAAHQAAARETLEEAGIRLDPADFVQFAHWTPPPGPQKRFATWFFVTQLDADQKITIDDGEIKEHAWINPNAALARHGAGEIDLAPPTWITLHHLGLYSPSQAVIAHFRQATPKTYNTRVAKDAAGNRVAMWHGDAGYADWDADQQGPRHRLVMAAGGFEFENDVEAY